MKRIFISVILNLFQDLIFEETRCRNKFGMTKRIRGFTLIELLVVIAIIGVLSAFLVANFIGIKERSRDAQRKSDLRNIQAALEIHRSDQGSYPPSLSCGSSFAIGQTIYMQKIPCDPLTAGQSYSYTMSAGGYTLIACLENKNDSQLGTNPTNCTGSTTTWSYTLKNP